MLREVRQRHLQEVKRLHEKCLAAGNGRVYMPYALDAKYPKADREWAWQYVFPAHKTSRDLRSGVLGVAAVQDQTEPEGGSESAETWQERLQRLTGVDPTLCPVCQVGHLVYLEEIPPQPGLEAPAARAPPES